ncbi:MAG: type II toxin-antitoxin system VapC family toxin [Betaproteobacteria bacterium]|nr:type II toxin-antitoxin system VapC family toxin [Betaproteobacteria bacterium]
MVVGYVFDTNTCIYLINGSDPAQHILDRLARIGVGVEVGVSIITVAELRFGVANSQRKRENEAALHRFLVDFVILPFDQAAARAYSPVRVHLESKGKKIGPLDTLIAAHALSLEAVMVTNNAREFPRVHGLKCENWAVP